MPGVEGVLEEATPEVEALPARLAELRVAQKAEAEAVGGLVEGCPPRWHPQVSTSCLWHFLQDDT